MSTLELLLEKRLLEMVEGAYRDLGLNRERGELVKRIGIGVARELETSRQHDDQESVPAQGALPVYAAITTRVAEVERRNQERKNWKRLVDVEVGIGNLKVLSLITDWLEQNEGVVVPPEEIGVRVFGGEEPLFQIDWTPTGEASGASSRFYLTLQDGRLVPDWELNGRQRPLKAWDGWRARDAIFREFPDLVGAAAFALGHEVVG